MAKNTYLYSSKQLEEIKRLEESMLLIFSMDNPSSYNLNLYKELSKKWEKLTGWKSY
jgi:hypothetical protein